MSVRGGASSLAKILETLTFAREIAHFEPDVIIIDGFDFQNASEEAIKSLVTVARERNVELWLSAPCATATSPSIVSGRVVENEIRSPVGFPAASTTG